MCQYLPMCFHLLIRRCLFEIGSSYYVFSRRLCPAASAICVALKNVVVISLLLLLYAPLVWIFPRCWISGLCHHYYCNWKLESKGFWRWCITLRIMDFVHCPEFWKLENTTSRKLVLFQSSGDGTEISTLLGPLERANLIDRSRIEVSPFYGSQQSVSLGSPEDWNKLSFWNYVFPSFQNSRQWTSGGL
jgi:hypothetical protein